MSINAIRGALARRFLIKVKRATHRSPSRLFVPDAKRVLVIAPHMDDEVIPCGGTLLFLAKQDANINVTFVSDSSAGLKDPVIAANVRAIRQAEAARVREFMGFNATTELGFPDGELVKHEGALADSLIREIERIDPDLIFCPFPTDAHSDHMSCASATARAAEASKWSGSLLAYEVWTPLWPNVAVDISEFAERKAEAIRLYASQIADRDYASATLGLNRFRGLAHAVSYAEAFYQADRSAFARLANLLDEI